MEFTVNRAELLRELNLAHGAVEKLTTLPILTHVLIEAAAGKVVITATDLDMAIRCSCAARIQTSGSIAVPAKRFLDYVKLLPGDDIEIKRQENDWIGVTCGRARARMAAMSRDSWPALPDNPEDVTEIPAAVLAGMIARTEFAIAHEESRFTLDGAQFRASESICLVATDGHRLALCGAAEGKGRKSVLVPRKALAQLAKLCATEEETVRFAHHGNHLFFEVGSRLLISRELNGSFPDYNRVLPKTHAHTVQVDRMELKNAIERVAQFSDERSRAIRIIVHAGELLLTSSVSTVGESEESVPVAFDSARVEIGFNAGYLLDFLKVVTSNFVDFLFTDGKSAGEFRPSGESGEGYRYVVMPMRV